MDHNSNSMHQPNKEDPEHGLITELASRLTSGLHVPSCNSSLRPIKDTCGVTPPNTPSTARVTLSAAATENPLASAADKTTVSALSGDRVEEKSVADNLVENKETLVETENRTLKDSSGTYVSAVAFNSTSGAVVNGIAHSDTMSRVEESTDEASLNNIIDDSTNLDNKTVENHREEDEHTLIRDCASRLSRAESLKQPATVTTAAITNADVKSSSRLPNAGVRSPMISRTNGSRDEEHSLISGYTSTLTKSPSLRSASTPRGCYSERVPRRAEKLEGNRDRPDGPMDVEHALISEYTNSLAQSVPGTSRTSRRSSIELDIEATERFYETQRKVFIQLQQQNLELRKKIAEMKVSEPSSTTQSVRSESPLPPAPGNWGMNSLPPTTGNWNTSEYYRYTQSEGTMSDGQPSPRGGQDEATEDGFPVFHGREGDIENGDPKERTFERNARLQALKEKREQLTQLLKRLSDEATRSTTIDYDNSALSVN